MQLNGIQTVGELLMYCCTLPALASSVLLSPLIPSLLSSVGLQLELSLHNSGCFLCIGPKLHTCRREEEGMEEGGRQVCA